MSQIESINAKALSNIVLQIEQLKLEKKQSATEFNGRIAALEDKAAKLAVEIQSDSDTLFTDGKEPAPSVDPEPPVDPETKPDLYIALKQIGEHSESGAYHDCEIGQEEEKN